MKAFDPIWLAGFRINGRKVADDRSGRIFLLGDAAHVHSPAGGQGMNTGMQDAFNLAWKLALVIRGDCGEYLLDSYSPERSAVGDKVPKAAGRPTAIGTLNNSALQSVRNLVGHFMFGLAPVQHAFADSMTEVAIGYPESPLNGRGPHLHDGPAEGERAPIQNKERPIGAGAAPRFALFAKSGDGAASLLAKYSNLLEATPREPFHTGGIWLVRPDGYVALTTKQDRWEDVAKYINRIVVTRS